MSQSRWKKINSGSRWCRTLEEFPSRVKETGGSHSEGILLTVFSPAEKAGFGEFASKGL